MSESDPSEEEYKDDLISEESDFDDFIDDDEDFGGKSKNTKRGKNISKSSLKKSISKPSIRKNISSKMDLDEEEEIESINEKLDKMDTEEKEVRNTRNHSKNKNNIKTNSERTQNDNLNSSKKTNLNNKKLSKEAEELLSNKKKDRKKHKQNIIPEFEGILNALTFVVTGVFPIDRDDLTNLLKGYGARVTGSISKKTSYLLHGDELEDGRAVHEGNKYKEATRLNVKKMNQQDFEEFMQDKLNDPSFSIITSMDTTGVNTEINIGRIRTDENSGKESKGVTNFEDRNKNLNQELWTTRHAPKQLSEIIGNQKTIFNFITWLDDWEDVVLNNNKKKVQFKGRGKIENINARACLISGDPGIGKTTTVRLIAKLKGYKTYELNASDQRNKAIISSKLGFLLDNKTLDHGEIQNKNLIIMDEVDGMAGNEDRGGMAALIDVIKKTKVPIVCIANDKQNQKLRSLINYCYDLKFNKPDKRYIANRLQEICKKENFIVEPNALEYLCESVGNDIRQCINFLEFWSRKFKDLKYFDMSNNYNKFNKDSSIMISNFDAASKLLNKQLVRKYLNKSKIFLIKFI
jgi:replication factor C subunit 1